MGNSDSIQVCKFGYIMGYCFWVHDIIWVCVPVMVTPIWDEGIDNKFL